MNTTKLPYARLQALPLPDVIIQNGFWQRKRAINRDHSVPHGYDMLVDSGVMENFRMAAAGERGEHHGMRFQDSDAYKWIEAAAFEIGNQDDADLRSQIESQIDLIEAAQDDNGYLNTFYQVTKTPDERWTKVDHDHELYCAGHLIQAALAYYRSAGSTRLLEIANRFIDHIETVFGPGKREEAPGHEEIELALADLYTVTGNERDLRLAQFFLDERGKGTMKGWQFFDSAYYQDRVPVRQLDQVEGHAVRALYLASGMAAVYMHTGEQALLDSLRAQWRDMTEHKLYVTAAVGARHFDEAFGKPYDLPDESSYCETCAAIASVMWNWRMLLITGESRYADLIERTLYNAFLSGVSLDGRGFFYVNPLSVKESHTRQPWFHCACCPPNVMRLISSIQGYLTTVSERELQVHQYTGAEIATVLPDVGSVKLHMETAYPWQETVTLRIAATPDAEWSLRLRIPYWCSHAELRLNDEILDVRPAGGTVTITRVWAENDVVALRLPMTPQLTVGHPYIDATRGSAALEYGPLVYCLEAVDLPEGQNLQDVTLDPRSKFESIHKDDLLGGTIVIEGHGYAQDLSNWSGRLYNAYDTAHLSPRRALPLRFIPYHQWANRGPWAMRVWIPLG
jgi:uncharacterized protein